MFDLLQHPPHAEIIKSRITDFLNKGLSSDLEFVIFIIYCWWLVCGVRLLKKLEIFEFRRNLAS